MSENITVEMGDKHYDIYSLLAQAESLEWKIEELKEELKDVKKELKKTTIENHQYRKDARTVKQCIMSISASIQAVKESLEY